MLHPISPLLGRKDEGDGKALIIENYLEATLRALISRVSREIFLAEVFL
jgi:hypothetical protein